MADTAENKYRNAQAAADAALAESNRLAAAAKNAKTKFLARDNEAKVAAHSRDKLINLNIFHFWPEARTNPTVNTDAAKEGEAHNIYSGHGITPAKITSGTRVSYNGQNRNWNTQNTGV